MTDDIEKWLEAEAAEFRRLGTHDLYLAPSPALKVAVEALDWIRLNDWGWAGGGSATRHQGEFGRLAARALGVELGLKPGWPSENGDDKLSAAALATIRAQDGSAALKGSEP